MGSKFIQTGDIHIGECRSFDGYLDRHKEICIQITNHAHALGGPLVVAGDIYHSKNTTFDERFLLDWWIGELERRKLHTIITTGNHDHIYGEVTQLSGLMHMPLKYVTIVDREPKAVKIGDIGFICMSWRDYTTEQIESTVKRLLPVIDEMKYKVVILHECLKGVALDNGQILPIGTAIPNMPEVTYWAIGDIHKFQKTNVSNGYYAGSPAQFRFDDKLPKGVLEVDLDHPSLEPKLLPIKVKPLKTVNSVSEMKEDAYYKVVGSFDEVMKANREDNVVKSELSRSYESNLEYKRVGIVDGLPEYLAGKGVDDDLQSKGVNWVRDLLNLEGESSND